jgi:hypothetical protein
VNIPSNHKPTVPTASVGVVQEKPQPKRILLGQLNSFGDCLFATAVARQIKADYPGCHLTWAIGSMCRSILEGNPYVDEVWEIPLRRLDEVEEVWYQFEREALNRKKRGDFDEVFLTQLAPANLQNYDGTLRSSIMRAYGRPITVPISPVVRLSRAEIEKVRSFAEAQHLKERSHVILFESSPRSGQSCLTQDRALEIARKLLINVPETTVILSSNISFQSPDSRIIDGSYLSLRENAELTKYCSLLVGGSSGISWIATSDWAKPLPMIQLIKADALWLASFIHDYEYWGLPTDTIIELTDCSIDKVVDCITFALTEGFRAARTKYHERVPMNFHAYQMFMAYFLLRGRLIKAFHLLHINIRRYGLRSQLFRLPLRTLLKTRVQSFLKKMSALRGGFIVLLCSLNALLMSVCTIF